MAVDINDSLGGFTGGLGGGVFSGGAATAYRTIKSNFYTFAKDVLDGMDATYGTLVRQGRSRSLIEKTDTWIYREGSVENFLRTTAGESSIVVNGVFSYIRWDQRLYSFIKTFESELLKDLESLENKEAAKKSLKQRAKFVDDTLAKLPDSSDTLDDYTAGAQKSVRITEYDKTGSAFDFVNRDFQGWFGTAINPEKSMVIQYIGARCESEDGLQKSVPVAILKYDVDNNSSIGNGEIAYYGNIDGGVKPGPDNTHRYANGYMYQKIQPVGLYPGSIYVALAYYYSEGNDPRQDDRYHYSKDGDYHDLVDMEIASSRFKAIEAENADPSNREGLLASFQDIVSLDSLSYNTNETRALQAANIALATKGPFSSREKEAWPVIQRPREPSQAERPDGPLTARANRAALLIIPGGSWMYEGAYGLNNHYVWEDDDFSTLENPAKINPVSTIESGMFLYAFLCDSYTEYPDFDEATWFYFPDGTIGVIDRTTTIARMDLTPLYSGSEGAFIGRTNFVDFTYKGNSIAPLTVTNVTERFRQYQSMTRFALVTSKDQPPDIAVRDWGPDPRPINDPDGIFIDLLTPFDQHKPNQNVLVEGRTFEFLCWMSNTDVSQITPSYGGQQIQNFLHGYGGEARYGVSIIFSGLSFYCGSSGPLWTYVGLEGDVGLVPRSPSQISISTNFAGESGEVLYDIKERALDYMRPGEWNHVAMVVSQEEVRVYLNGQKMLSIAQPYRNFSSEEYDKIVATMGLTAIQLFNTGYADGRVTVEYSNPNELDYDINYTSGIDYNAAVGPPKIKGIRYTERPLYSGESFNPPSEILDPA